MSTPTSKTILCIDDDNINLLVLKHLVHSMGYSTESASSGEEGLAILKNKAIDLVLLGYKNFGQALVPYLPEFYALHAIRKRGIA